MSNSLNFAKITPSTTSNISGLHNKIQTVKNELQSMRVPSAKPVHAGIITASMFVLTNDPKYDEKNETNKISYSETQETVSDTSITASNVKKTSSLPIEVSANKSLNQLNSTVLTTVVTEPLTLTAAGTWFVNYNINVTINTSKVFTLVTVEHGLSSDGVTISPISNNLIPYGNKMFSKTYIAKFAGSSQIYNLKDTALPHNIYIILRIVTIKSQNPVTTNLTGVWSATKI